VDVDAKTHHCIHAVLGCERPPAMSHVVSAPHELEGAGTRAVQIAVAQSYGYSCTVAMIMHQLSREDGHMDRSPLKPWLHLQASTSSAQLNSRSNSKTWYTYTLPCIDTRARSRTVLLSNTGAVGHMGGRRWCTSDHGLPFELQRPLAQHAAVGPRKLYADHAVLKQLLVEQLLCV